MGEVVVSPCAAGQGRAAPFWAEVAHRARASFLPHTWDTDRRRGRGLEISPGNGYSRDTINDSSCAHCRQTPVTAPVLSASVSFGSPGTCGTNPSNSIHTGIWMTDRRQGQEYWQKRWRFLKHSVAKTPVHPVPLTGR